METSEKAQLIFIGKVAEYFDDNLQPLGEITGIKFVMIKNDETSPIKMLLMDVKQYEYHAEGVLKYMHDNQLTSIITNGGGRMQFHHSICMYYDRSTTFKSVCDEEVRAIIKTTWPSLEIIDLKVPLAAEPFAISGKRFTYDEIIKICDKLW